MPGRNGLNIQIKIVGSLFYIIIQLTNKFLSYYVPGPAPNDILHMLVCSLARNRLAGEPIKWKTVGLFGIKFLISWKKSKYCHYQNYPCKTFTP